MKPLSQILRASLATITLLLALAACSNRNEPVYHDQFFVFGTLVELTLYATTAGTGEQASQQVEQALARMHADWHAWEPGALTRTNELLASLKPFSPEPVVLPVIRAANRLSSLSGGLFNPTIGKLVALWGFHSQTITDHAPPDEGTIRTLLENAPTVEDIKSEDNRLSCNNPAVQYDLGAFAKGYGIDRAIEHLRAMGIHNAIVNAGGDLRAIGQHGERPWRIGIRHPRATGILASVEISEDASVFTSGDYERYFEHDGKRYHHILDPRSGYPASGAVSVTVIHTDAATADAAATALFVAGADNWPVVARQMGIKYVMLVDKDGVIHMNPAMHSRIRFTSETTPEIRLSEKL